MVSGGRMTIDERELRQRLSDDDDDIVRSTLRRFFRPRPRFTAPLLWDWMPLPDLDQVLGGEGDGGLLSAASRRVIDLANAADAALRQRRFERRRRQDPALPVVVCEGDSWLSHPFIDEIGDHLFEDGRGAFHVLNRGAAGDRLETVANEREHEVAIDEFGPSVMVLSGGGNDLLLQFHEFLHRTPHPTGTEPSRLVTRALDLRLGELMSTVRRIVQGIRDKDPEIPVLIHGYDYLRVAAAGSGKFLAPHFDTAGIEGDERQQALDHIVDRFNDHLRDAVEPVPGVSYVNLRGTVSETQWYDEIHPDENGFRRLTHEINGAVRERLGLG